MIHYERTNWYGVTYFFRLHGSLLPRCLPSMVLAGVLSGLAASGFIEDHTGWNVDGLFGEDDYAMQLFGVVFGFLSVTRLNMSYSRYWEGISMIKQMHSKWADACVQVVAFDRIYANGIGCGDDPFCNHIVRLFCQLSAMATISLHDDDWQFTPPPEVDEQGNTITPRGSTVVERLVHLPVEETELFRRSSANLSKDLLAQRLANMGETGRASQMNGARFQQRRSATQNIRLIDEEEQTFLARAPDPVLATVQRLCRAISTRHQFGGVCAPAPIVSRIFQELSNGLLAYNAATKMKEVPVPFAYVQFNAMLLCLFVLITPVAIAAFTQQIVSSVVISCIVVGGFSAMWIVANELEDPFGDDANDLPMIGYHEHFVRSLMRMSTTAWLPRDKWIVQDGLWVDPDTQPPSPQHARLTPRDTDEAPAQRARRTSEEAAIRAANGCGGMADSVRWQAAPSLTQSASLAVVQYPSHEPAAAAEPPAIQAAPLHSGLRNSRRKPSTTTSSTPAKIAPLWPPAPPPSQGDTPAPRTLPPVLGSDGRAEDTQGSFECGLRGRAAGRM